MATRKINTIIFDLSEVYLRGIQDVEHSLESVLNISAKKICVGLRGKSLVDLFHGKITEDEYWRQVIQDNNWVTDIRSLKKAVRENFKEIHGTRGIIKKLKTKKYKLGLLSVHANEWIDYCNKKFDYHKLFHSILYSFEIAISKPDKRAYELILEKLKSQPEECVFIDDMLINLMPAKELGIETIHFKNVKQLKKDLNSFGIKIN